MKWHSSASVRRLVFVSPACNDRQRVGWDFVRQVLAGIDNPRVQLQVGDWAVLGGLLQTYKRSPSFVIAVVESNELKLPVAALVLCAETFLETSNQRLHVCVDEHYDIIMLSALHFAEVCARMGKRAMTLASWMGSMSRSDPSMAVSGLVHNERQSRMV